ncbi:MAG: mercuric transporter MerT family protein [Gemmatimonadales bacterium]
MGAALTAAAATLCCVGPAVVAIVGVGGAVAAAALKPYRLLLILVSVALLGFGFWLAYQPKAILGSGAVACPTGAGRLTRRIVWISAVVWLGAVLLPFLISFLS